ncbi:DUF4296 domain-containing protein [Flaviaesturariibacter terrae]
MMRFLCVAVLVLLFSCGGDRLPKDVLPPARMALVLKQLLIADEWVGYRRERDTLFDANAERIHRYRAAFREAGISEAQFRSSFAYYEAHPELLRNVFDTLQRQPNIDTVAAPAAAPAKAPRRKTAPSGPVN